MLLSRARWLRYPHCVVALPVFFSALRKVAVAESMARIKLSAMTMQWEGAGLSRVRLPWLSPATTATATVAPGLAAH